MAYGRCGLRVGYGLCGSAEFRTAVDAVRQPFYCNVAAQAAAIAALGSQHWNALRSQVVKQRESDVQSARAALSGIPAVDRSGGITPGVEAALRKVAG